MGLNRTTTLLTSSFFLLSLVAQAAPKLRVSTNSIGPLPVAPGTSLTVSGLSASNAGDGALNLQITSSAAWLSATAGREAGCGLVRCLPLTLTINTSGLQKGLYSGRLTLSDPAALDAPQFIEVRISVAGGALPERLDVYLPTTGATRSYTLPVASPGRVTVTTASGGDWLKVLPSSATPPGSSYDVQVNSSGLPEGTYNGTVQVANSSIAGENRSIPVTLRVTAQPVAAIPSNPIRLRLAPNTRQEVPYFLSNLGSGTLTISSVTPKLDAGATWLTARTEFGYVFLTYNTAGLQPGVYKATVAIASNAANTAQELPVEVEVVAAGAPYASPMGAVNNATFESEGFVAPGEIMAVFGEQLSTGEPILADKTPLPTQLGNTRVLVNGIAAPLYYSSYNQVNFQLPYEIGPGDASVRIERDGQLSNPVSLQVRAQAPRIITVGAYGKVVNQDGSFVAPRGYLGLNAHPAKPGDVLVMYAIGLGQTSPAATTGAAATATPLLSIPNYRILFGEPNPFYGGLEVPAQFAGLTPGFVGLYQINFQVPENAPKGDVVATVLLGDGAASNKVILSIE